MTREELLQRIAKYLLSIRKTSPVMVAIDGASTSGKTTLANELVPFIKERGRSVVQASVDGFHRPRIERHKRGEASPEGYYYDSFDYDAMKKVLLTPLAPGGDRMYRTAVFDFRTDRAVEAPLLVASPDAILLFEGIFLLRPELNAYWDARIFLHIDFKEVIQRASTRDQHLFGTADQVRERYLKRYIPGEQFYLDTVHPEEIAQIVINNNNVQDPQILKFQQADW